MAGMNWRAKNIGTMADFFSGAECGEYIQLGERIGFEEATISTARGAILMKDDRDNDRVMSMIRSARWLFINGSRTIWGRVFRRNGHRPG